jgi:hypothetical protein
MIKRSCRLLVPGLALAIASFALTREARAATFAPACTGTAGDSAALITALATANTNGQADTITLGAGCTYELSNVNNVATGGGDDGLPAIVSDAGNAITIVGNGATITRATAAPAFRIFAVAGGTLNLSDVTVSNGNSSTHGGGLVVFSGAATLTNVTVSGNSSASWGAGLHLLAGTLSIKSSTVSGNTSGSDSGGLNIDGGTATIVNSTFSGNTAVSNGGGVGNFISGSATIVNSTFAGNTANKGGGGLFNSSTGSGAITVTNSLMALNNTGLTAPDAGVGADAGAGFAPDVGGAPFVDGGNNLIGDATGAPASFTVTTLKGTGAAKIDPLLGALAANGGPTQTRALLAGSPAANAANAAVCAAAPVSGLDQRGTARAASSCDIGAFELAGSGTIDGGGGNDGSSGSDGSATGDSGGPTFGDDSGTLGDVDSGSSSGGKDGGNGGEDTPSSSSGCTTSGAPGNALGLSALILGAAMLAARRRNRR